VLGLYSFGSPKTNGLIAMPSSLGRATGTAQARERQQSFFQVEANRTRPTETGSRAFKEMSKSP